MKKTIRRVLLCVLAACFFRMGGLAADREAWKQKMISFHPAAVSNSSEDRQDRLRESLQSAMKNAADLDSAREYIQNNLGQIRRAAAQVLEELGCTDRTAVALSWKEYCTRKSEELPAGFCHVLRILVGAGEGRNE